ncbi:MAG: helicase-exonuclease AddAB subunit AddA [Clostridia bacterium]
MKIELTDEQRAAVEAKVGENLVSAAAGSGKTKVLSERIVKRVKSGDTSIDRLLIVTFTRAAATQMRERIYKALEEAVKTKPSENLKKQLSLVSGADICTIDAFCIDLVRKNFFRVEVPSDFTIADSGQMAILREEVLLDVLDELYEKGDKDFLSLANSVGSGKNDNSLKEMILTLYFAAMAYENPEEWLDKAVNMHLCGSKENDKLFDCLKKEAEDQFADLKTILYLGANEAENLGVESYRDVFNEEIRELENIFHLDVSLRAEAFSLGKFKRKKEEDSLKEEKEILKAIHEEAKDLLGKICNTVSLYKSRRGISYNKIKALTDAVKLFKKYYYEEKISRKELEFADCEYLAVKILKGDDGEEVCEQLRDKYDEIYIDEYQDTNPLQDSLFEIISRKARGEGNLFIVGDVKQSIYRFRHTDPTLFSDKAKRLENSKDGRKMILSKNFRSRREVIDSVNNVFENIMRENTANISYDEEHKLRCGAKYIEYSKNKSEIYILQKKYETEFDDEELSKEHKETLIVAQKIREMMDEGFMVSDKDGMRHLRFSDIAVLSPVIKGKVDMFRAIFDLMDIPVYCEAGKSFFDTMEIQTVIALLKAVDNPLSDIPLAATLRSPMFSFTENELMEIRLQDKDVPFYDNVVEKAKLEDPTGEKCAEFLKVFSTWRDASKVMGVEPFLQKILQDKGYYSFVGALPGGRARQENLRTFMDMALRYETTQFKGLYNFVRYVEKSAMGDVSVDSIDCGIEDAVLITSVHKSKGLEFPVVFLIGCGKGFNDKDARSNMIFTPSGAVGIVETVPEKRLRYKTGEYGAIALMIKKESHAEAQRLLYVAMTRAKEKLILVGTVDNIEKKVFAWESYRKNNRLSDYKIRSFENFLDYVCPVADEKYWDVHYIDELPEIVKKVEQSEKKKESTALIDGVVDKLNYVYPYMNVQNIPSKMSVSEIKKMSMEEEMCVDYYSDSTQKRIPKFLQKDTALKGAGRGTAYHRVMELIDLNETDVKGAIAGFVEKGLMRGEEAECIDVEKIETFLKSPLADRMRNAKRIWREEPFTISIDAKDVYAEGENEKICVQGTVDCFFEDCDGKLVLLDYKTDFYTDKEEIRAKYKKQLELYEVAIFNKFSQNCNDKYLYLFHNDDIINV